MANTLLLCLLNLSSCKNEVSKLVNIWWTDVFPYNFNEMPFLLNIPMLYSTFSECENGIKD